MKFREKLRRLGTCIDAQEWVGNKGLATCWNTCNNWHWLDYLVWKLWRNGAVTHEQYKPINAIWEKYCNTDICHKDFNKTIANEMRKHFTAKDLEKAFRKWLKLSEAGDPRWRMPSDLPC